MIKMRVPVVAGNWKMHKTVAETRELVFSMLGELKKIERVERVICPPFVSLVAASSLLTGSGIGVGAQNMHWEDQGAFTGEVSPLMVKELASYVILGHSERRAYFCESDATVQRKLKAAERHDLTPIVCVGEVLEEREAGRTAAVVEKQILDGLAGLSPDFASRLIVAYEPVWAIGTGKASTPEDANQVIGEVIRPALAQLYGAEVAQTIRVLYGGSVKPENATGFFAQPEIDGALVGGASLKAADFIAIARAAAEAVV
jgi:triosephosphate isomerase